MFDFLALRYAGKPLAYRRAALASSTSLSLGHNIRFAALRIGAIEGDTIKLLATADDAKQRWSEESE